MYTSGTTGSAKGVILTHYNIIASVAGLDAGLPMLNHTDVFIGYLPLAHILEFAAEVMCLVCAYILIVFQLRRQGKSNNWLFCPTFKFGSD